MKILLADDSALIRTSISKTLVEKGFEIILCNDGAEALQKIIEHKDVWVAILDWQMPKITGPEVCRAIRGTKIGRYVYSVLLSSHDDSDRVVQGMEAGADDYILKSASAEEFCLRVKAGVRVASLHKQLHRERSKLEQVMDSLPMFCMSIDGRNRVNTWNPFCEEMFGLPAVGVVGKPLNDLALAWDSTGISAAIEECRTTGANQYLGNTMYHCERKNETRILDLEICPIARRLEQQGGVILLGTDVTEKQKLLEEVRRKNRLESIGNLAAGIAHELNTPLQYIRDNSIFLDNEFSGLSTLIASYEELLATVRSNEDTKELVQNIEGLKEKINLQFVLTEVPLAIKQTLEGAESVVQIVRSIKQLSHPGVNAKISCDINKLLESAVTISQNEWKQVANLELELEQELPSVTAFPGALGQAFLNLIVNAAQAMGKSIADEQARGALRISSQRDKDWVFVQIEDSGPGISPEIIDKIFDPFFTTKDVDQGSGQGLALVHSTIVDQHAGSVSVASKVDHGSIFKVGIPING